MFVSIRRVTHLMAASVLCAGLVSSACGGYNPLNPSDFGIQTTDIVAGSGTQLRQGRGATVDYILWLYDADRPDGKGTLVQSLNGFSFVLGFGQVISGWDIGLDGMKVGGKRRLVVPPEHGYGSTGSGQIPANATLVFEISLTGVY